jgi:hypothetical protein
MTSWQRNFRRLNVIVELALKVLCHLWKNCFHRRLLVINLYSLALVIVTNSHIVNFRNNIFFVCVGVMYSGEYDVCDVTLSVYPQAVKYT